MRRRRSQELSADPLCGTGRSTLDEKHIVNYILSCNAPPLRSNSCAQTVKGAFLSEI